ncbi:TPA: hypothetical protein JD334_01195 [Citrobacter freundii]|nr:hypothetical protein [Citrobacter freundii]
MAPGSLAWVTASNHFGDMKNPPLGADFFCLQYELLTRFGFEDVGTKVVVVHLLQLKVGDVHWPCFFL